jgi:6-phosphogluconolactonase
MKRRLKETVTLGSELCTETLKRILPMSKKVLFIVMCWCASVVPAESLRVYIGTYTGRGGSQGIYSSQLDLDTGQLSAPVLVAETTNPSFLEIHPNGKILYTVSEVGKGAAVNAFRIDADSGTLSPLNQKPSGGAAPCHVSIDPGGRHLLVANYSGGSAAIFPIKKDGRLGERSGFVQHRGSSVNQQRQSAPHAHSINLSPDGRFALVADLGLDRIMIYRFDAARGTIVPHDPAFAALKPGAGPRHLVFHPSAQFAYVINELNGTVCAFSYASTNGSLKEIQIISTLPEGFQGSNSCAEIRVHPSGAFLYGSNRGHDSIVVYQIDLASGRLSWVEHETTDIKAPRNFNIDPTGSFCIVANQSADSVVVFRIDQTSGCLNSTGQKISVDKPVCIRFLKP